jgi:hypothetical protein
MCEFVSWVESDGHVLFLTASDVFEGRKGKELREYCGSSDDYVGHGAIRYFYGLSDFKGANKECTDFSSPTNFPAEIVAAIKNGQMRGLGISKELLKQSAWAEYEKVRQSAWAEYEKVKQSAWAEYKKVRQSALAEYEKVRQSAWAEYEKVEQSAWAEYKKVEQSALAEYEKVRQSAWAEYEKVRQDTFWNLFAVKKNRASAWR